jgi:hypothetical protein
MFLDPWQALTLEQGMAVRADGSWAASDVGCIASRQNGKNGTIEVRELYGLAVLDEWIIHTAHLFPTAKESYKRLLDLIEAHPDVKGELIYQVASPMSGFEMRFRNGGRIRFIARSRSSGRGLSGDLLICDEAQDLTDDDLGALLPTISASADPQTWYFGSAPDARSEVFHRIRKRGREGTDPRLAYLEFSADPALADMDDRDAWAQANPALGVRINEETIESERGVMSDEMFARERLSISPDLLEGGEQIINPVDWVACRDVAAGLAGEQFAFSLDVPPSRDSAVIAVAGPAGRGGIHVEVVERAPGTGWVVAKAKELYERWAAPLAVTTGSPAASLLVELEAAGVPVLTVTPGDHAQACGRFYDRVGAHELRHIGQAWLDAAVLNAARKFYGDAWVWDRRQPLVDISPLVAATLAVWAFEQAPEPEVALIDLNVL